MTTWTTEQLQRAKQINQEVHEEGGEAEQRLCAKCNWEHMTRIAVILEWGDPREWKD